MSKVPEDQEWKSGTPIALQDALKKSVTEMLVLYVLKEKPMYTYEMMQSIKDFSSGELVFNTLYQAIYRLLNFGYIKESRKLLSDDNRIRVYFSITSTGLEYLSQLKGEYLTIINAVDHFLSSFDKLGGET